MSHLGPWRSQSGKKKDYKVKLEAEKYSSASVPVLLSFNSPGGVIKGWTLAGSYMASSTHPAANCCSPPPAARANSMQTLSNRHSQLQNTGRYASEVVRVKLFTWWIYNLLNLLKKTSCFQTTFQFALGKNCARSRVSSCLSIHLFMRIFNLRMENLSEMPNICIRFGRWKGCWIDKRYMHLNAMYLNDVQKSPD